jgi:4-diphosphocytidyl-2-C-methyl-D-erythritol kinase
MRAFVKFITQFAICKQNIRMICFPNAKINLGLHVINKRDDGYHNIETVFYPVPCTDMLEVITDAVLGASGEEIKLTTEGIKVEGDAADNLAVKAYYLLVKDHELPPVECVLYKGIPMGAGLGGGSADAGFMITLLNAKYALGLDANQMRYYAAQLGSDCAFFIDNKPAYAYGRGYELEDFGIDLSAYHIELLYPGVHSGTALAYRDVMKRGSLSGESSLKTLLRQPVQEWKGLVENDFEHSVFSAIPGLPKIKEELYACGAIYASMSGSGSAMFGIFERKPDLPAHLQKMTCYSGGL